MNHYTSLFISIIVISLKEVIDNIYQLLLHARIGKLSYVGLPDRLPFKRLASVNNVINCQCGVTICIEEPAPLPVE